MSKIFTHCCIAPASLAFALILQPGPSQAEGFGMRGQKATSAVQQKAPGMSPTTQRFNPATTQRFNPATQSRMSGAGRIGAQSAGRTGGKFGKAMGASAKSNPVKDAAEKMRAGPKPNPVLEAAKKMKAGPAKSGASVNEKIGTGSAGSSAGSAKSGASVTEGAAGPAKPASGIGAIGKEAVDKATGTPSKPVGSGIGKIGGLGAGPAKQPGQATTPIGSAAGKIGKIGDLGAGPAKPAPTTPVPNTPPPTGPGTGNAPGTGTTGAGTGTTGAGAETTGAGGGGGVPIISGNAAPIAIGGLAGAYVGSTYYSPDRYVAVAQPACRGMTPEGCALRRRSVPLEDGTTERQCVRLCPRAAATSTTGQRAASPQAVAAQPASCEVAIYSDPSFAGTSTSTSQNQPRLTEAGWRNEIASLQVKGGTWVFFSDDDYAGETMRLEPGQYASLGDKWTKQIGSFMCMPQ
jgi:hypothetical protein